MGTHHNYPAGSENEPANNNTYQSRREIRANNPTGILPVITSSKSYSSPSDFDNLIASLRELFAQDRQIASQQDSRRCGICYLYFQVSEVQYREEDGFYVCSGCEKALGKQKLPMIRRQQK